jgi:hypothetical protein
MSSMGVDVARGGKDSTVIAKRHDTWFDKLVEAAGSETPDGQTGAALVLVNRRDSAPVHVDGIGVGSSVVDQLRDANAQVVSVNVAESSHWHGKAGNLTFANLRSELWWRMREALDPQNDRGYALPPDKDLARELCTPKWRMNGKAIYVQSREEIVKEIGRSPDRATAVILANMDTPNQMKLERQARERATQAYDPIEAHAAHQAGRAPAGAPGGYDPLASY